MKLFLVPSDLSSQAYIAYSEIAKAVRLGKNKAAELILEQITTNIVASKEFAHKFEFIVLSGSMDLELSDIVKPIKELSKEALAEGIEILENGIEAFNDRTNPEKYTRDKSQVLYNLRGKIEERIKEIDDNFEVFESNSRTTYSDSFTVYRVQYGEHAIYLKVDDYSSTIVLSDHSGESEFGRPRDILDNNGFKNMILSLLKSA